MRNVSQVRTLIKEKAANGWSDAINVAPYKHIVISVVTTGSAVGTIKVAGSLHEGDDVDFSSAAALDNEWDYLGLYDLNDQSTFFTGDTGFVASGAGVEQLLVSTNNMNTLAIELSGYSAGTFTVRFFASSDTGSV